MCQRDFASCKAHSLTSWCFSDGYTAHVTSFLELIRDPGRIDAGGGSGGSSSLEPTLLRSSTVKLRSGVLKTLVNMLISHFSVKNWTWRLETEAPMRAEFLQKRLISAFFGFQWLNLAEILHLFKKYNNVGKVAVKRVSLTDYALWTLGSLDALVKKSSFPFHRSDYLCRESVDAAITHFFVANVAFTCFFVKNVVITRFLT